MYSTLRYVQALSLPLALLMSMATAQTSFSDLSSKCVDPAGFNSCWANVTSTAGECFSIIDKCNGTGSCTDENNCASTKAICSSGCVCDAYSGWLNCALANCWNEVYSCEYQNLAMQAHQNCPGAGDGALNTDTVDGYIPYIPAPDDAAGGCSCDISFVYYRSSITYPCDPRLSNGTGPAATADQCGCCAASEIVSAFYNTCTNTSPASVPLWNVTVGSSLALLESAECTAALANGFDCHQQLGFPRPGISGGQFYNGSDLPANGTQGLSNTNNAVITSPIGGPTLVWKLGDKFSNMTAIAASATATGASNSSSKPNDAFSIRRSTGGSIQLLVLVVGVVAGMVLL